MVPTLFAQTVLGKAGRITDFQLVRNSINDCGRDVVEVLQKRAQKPDSAELQGESQAIVITSASHNEFSIGIVQMKKSRQLLGCRLPGVPAVAISLVIAQEADGHSEIQDRDSRQS
jgi:hypothetical protein